MSERSSGPNSHWVFSVRQLLAITTFVAVGLALTFAYQKNRALTLQRKHLQTLSGRLRIADLSALCAAAMPDVAKDYYSWQVYVPSGKDFELRLGIGNIPPDGIPPIVGNVRIPEGQHRVTLYSGDSVSSDFRYAVYLDGKLVIEKTMGRDWMPHGWLGAGSWSWPHASDRFACPLQLSGRSYAPNQNLGTGVVSKWQFNKTIAQPGYGLWIDQSNTSNQPVSPIRGFEADTSPLEIGLRD
jgi:hypothetical protein